MNADDFFSGWFFMIFLGPNYALINAIIAVPSTLFSRYVHKRAGFIVWVLTVVLIISYEISAFFKPYEINEAKHMMFALFWIIPQAVAYPLTRNHPWMRPLVAGVVTIGVAILYMTLGFLTGATPD